MDAPDIVAAGLTHDDEDPYDRYNPRHVAPPSVFASSCTQSEDESSDEARITEVPGADWPACWYCFRKSLIFGSFAECDGKPGRKWCKVRDHYVQSTGHRGGQAKMKQQKSRSIQEMHDTTQGEATRSLWHTTL